ncbi:MAG: flagellar hook-associated protein FlgK [Acidobacteriaceae bacterium]
MATLNTAWSIMQSALQANQLAINVSANNVANANTPGYTVRTVDWQEAGFFTPTAGPGGVRVAGTPSQRDRVLNGRIDLATQDNAASQARLSALNNVQAGFAASLNVSTAGGGTTDIGQQLSSFFNSLSQLAASPTNSSLRSGVLAAAAGIAADFNSAAQSLAAQQASLSASAVNVAGAVNSLTKNIAKINGQIASLTPGADAGSLEDQRQQDLLNLSQLVGNRQITTEGNGITVTTSGGAVLIDGSKSTDLTVANSPAGAGFLVGQTDVTQQLAVGGGQIGGMLAARDTDIPSVLGQLDILAHSVGTAINAAQVAGTDAKGNPGTPMFTFPGGTNGSAAGIALNLSDPSQIAAGASGTGTGDGSNASAMADVQDQAIVNGAKPTDFYASMVAAVGNLVSGVTTDQASQQASLTQLQTQQSALSSVNMDEEAAHLQSYEQAYQAASKVFSILNTVMASAINLGTETTVA